MDEKIREIAAGDIQRGNLSEAQLVQRIGTAALAAVRNLREEDEEFWAEERTNLARAQNGRDMAALANTGTSYLAYEEYESGLRDALANLMHFARRYEIDFDAELDRARKYHDDEAKYGWDEVPG